MLLKVMELAAAFAVSVTTLLFDMVTLSFMLGTKLLQLAHVFVSLQLPVFFTVHVAALIFIEPSNNPISSKSCIL